MSGYDQSRDMPFGPAGERAHFFHPGVVIFGSFFFFCAWALVPVLVLVSMDIAAGKTDPSAPDTLSVQYGLAALGASFALILLHFLFWTRVVERRPLTSIGLFRGGSLRLYANGIAYGALFALIVSLAAFVAALHFGFSVPQMLTGTQETMRPDVLLFVAMMVPVILLQGGTEEVVFRGWMLSAFSARTSITLGVLLSAVAFGAFHIDRLLVDPRFALVFISSTIVLGAFLGVWAVQAGSVAGPAGFHGAYNALFFILSYLDQAADAKPGSTTAQIWADLMSFEATQEMVRHTDYIAAMETAVAVCSLIGIAALLVTGKRDVARA